MPDAALDRLTDAQRLAWRMRHQYGWPLRRIADELGTSAPAVSRLLRRAVLRAGGTPRRPSSAAGRPRLTRFVSLSNVPGI